MFREEPGTWDCLIEKRFAASWWRWPSTMPRARQDVCDWAGELYERCADDWRTITLDELRTAEWLRDGDAWVYGHAGRAGRLPAAGAPGLVTRRGTAMTPGSGDPRHHAQREGRMRLNAWPRCSRPTRRSLLTPRSRTRTRPSSASSRGSRRARSPRRDSRTPAAPPAVRFVDAPGVAQLYRQAAADLGRLEREERQTRLQQG